MSDEDNVNSDEDAENDSIISSENFAAGDEDSEDGFHGNKG